MFLICMVILFLLDKITDITKLVSLANIIQGKVVYIASHIIALKIAMLSG